MLILAAAKFELDIFSRSLPSSKNFQFEEIGVGAIAAAKNVQKIRQKVKDQNVLLIGTGGIFGEFEKPFLVTSHHIIWSPPCERVGLSYQVQSGLPEICLKKSSELTHSLDEAIIVCSPAVTLESKAIPKQYNPSKLWIENLELYSVAEEIENECKSFDIILSVTNAIGSSAHEQWKKNNPIALHLISDYCNKNLFC